MEKYRSSADPSTGLHPFLPVSGLPGWRYFIQGLILYPLRVPAALVIGIFYVLLRFLIVGILRLIMLNFLARPLERLIDLWLRLFLLSCGTSTSSPSGRLQKAPSHGDLIFVNHSSYLDTLYLTAVFSPGYFAIPCVDGFYVLSPFAALNWTCSGCGQPSKSALVRTLDDAIARARAKSAGPLVLLAEGGTTNGVGVLRFVSTATNLRGSAYVIGLRYSKSRAECFTVGSFPSHFASVLASLRTEINARITHVSDTSANDLQREVARLAAVPVLRIGVEARVKFIDHWTSSSGGRGVSQYKKK